MIDIERFACIKQKHGNYASWAVWVDAGERPKSNVGDMSVFDLECNPLLLEVLQNNVLMVGLNISRSFAEPFRNFHDLSSRANDFKIRYAFQNTEYYGAYMTDIIKSWEMISSRDVLKHLNAHPVLIEENLGKFREELHDLSSMAPIILAFGDGAYTILKENIRVGEYSTLIKLTHYSHHISKEKYRDKVLTEISAALN